MHEYHIVENVVKQILQSARNAGALKILKVVLVMGEQSGLDESSVRLYFDNIAQGTLIEGTELLIRKVSGEMECKNCGLKFPCQKEDLSCPKCAALGAFTKSGKDF